MESSAGRPRGMASRTKSPMTSPSAVDISMPGMTRGSEGSASARATASSAPSTVLWSVTAMHARPLARAAWSNSAGDMTPSDENDVWL